MKDLDQKLSAFVDDFAGRPIHEITTPELDRWIRSLNVSGTTRNSYRRVLDVLFGFAVRMEYSLKNPAREIEKVSEQITKPGILTLPEADSPLAYDWGRLCAGARDRSFCRPKARGRALALGLEKH